MPSGRELWVRDLRSERAGRRRRIVAEADGSPLWFDSEDAALSPAPEAFVSALLPAAVAHGRDLVVDAPLDPVFAANLETVIGTFARWWGHRRIRVRATRRAGPPGADARPADAGATALCFSGGADSFYSLLRVDEPIEALVFAHGFDVALADAERADAYAPSLHRVAAAVGARAVWIRTNVQEHPVSRGVGWGRAHGGAMAALGHALPGVSRLVVAASYPKGYEHPWGSRWDLDAFWSSAATRLVHHGADRWRADKVRSLAVEPLAREHLRVCLVARGAALNCSRCEKCVRTMLVLAQEGVLDRFHTFDTGGSLAERVEGLRSLRPELGPVYAGFLEREPGADVAEALRALIARSRRRARRRAIKRRWRELKRAARAHVAILPIRRRSSRRRAAATPPPPARRAAGWSDDALRARISDAAKRERYAAASPDAIEIEAYAEGLGAARGPGPALVLGMTPELRCLALKRFAHVVSVELSPRAIALYRDWVPEEAAGRESIVRADWLDLSRLLPGPVAAILGDGVFGNLADVDEHRRLLRVLAGILAPGAPLVVRKALLPRGFDPDADAFPALLARHRRGALDPDEFGFAVRLLGHHRTCHDGRTHRLDNARLFASCERAFREGEIDADEWRAIRRYRFGGSNCILPQALWESLLEETGFAFEVPRTRGKDWYRYYPVYACRPRAPRS